MTTSRAWVIVLAAGEGTRISALTRDGDGRSIPKQYWAPDGKDSMLHSTLRRAGRISPAERILTVVAEHHERWWRPLLRGRPPGTVVRQPANRGTAAGILLPLLRVLERDREAVIAILPCDHHVSDEAAFERGLDRALSLARRQEEVILLGVAPDRPDPEYGWVLCGKPEESGARRVISFFEKPGGSFAKHLLREGALWSSFMFAARAESMLSLFQRAAPDLVRLLLDSAPSGGWTYEELSKIYATVPHRDFSRDVLEHGEHRLLMIQLPACGWLDLGTPPRIDQWRERRPPIAPARMEPVTQGGVS